MLVDVIAGRCGRGRAAYRNFAISAMPVKGVKVRNSAGFDALL
jgi:hypothetical protein